jgi:hypothetical protein
MNDADRLLLAHRLEHDAAATLADRVAGCLLLQYGQHVTRRVRLTVEVRPLTLALTLALGHRQSGNCKAIPVLSTVWRRSWRTNRSDAVIASSALWLVSEAATWIT